MLKVPFLRNILLLSILIAFCLPVYETYIINPSYRAMVIEQTEQEAIRYGNYLINTLNLARTDLQRGKISPQIVQEVGVLRKDRQLIKLRVFSAAGEIIYSTEPSEFGVINQKDYFLNIVAKGQTFSKVVEKHKLTADGVPTKIDVVETYVPIMDTNVFHGAIEVYYDTTRALQALNGLTKRSNMTLVVIVFGLVGAIFLALRRAYGSLCAQRETEKLLVEANEELEHRVAQRTRELEKINTEMQGEINEHLATTTELQKANKFNRTVINSMNDAVSIIDAKTFKVVDYNTVFKETLEADATDLIGNTCYYLTHNLDSPCAPPDHDCPLTETVESGQYVSYDHQHRDRQGNVRYVEVSTAPIFDDSGAVVQVVHVNRDVTERKQAAEKIEKIAYYDSLTGLPNRELLLDRLQQLIPQSQRTQTKFALLVLDLDRFKEINDSRGHSCGDQVLQAITERLQPIVRASDTLARLGGDEFVFLLSKIESEIDACVVAEKILKTIRAPISLDDCQAHMTTSIGISIYPGDGETSEVMLKSADMALYEAKSAGRDVYKFFSGEMNEKAQERHQLENLMHHALENQAFRLVYQPQIDLSSSEIIGVEALTRWQDLEFGFISPGRFIPVAEDSGLILPLGDWVLETACRQAKSWYEQGNKYQCVAVNISARQFQQVDFIEKVKKVLTATGLPAELLELELTESLLMQNGDNNIRLLGELKELGVRLSIDDFGTGYSSLSYLKDFPIDRIKIDQSFVRDLLENANDRVIVETIIAMAEQLGMEVIAEGVETAAQRDSLRERGCQLIQGYLYAKPMSPAELDLFTQNRGATEGS